MDFECRGDQGLFPVTRKDADGALWPIGVRADEPPTASPAVPPPDGWDASGQGAGASNHEAGCGGARGQSASDSQGAPSGTSPLTATLVVGGERVPLTIVADSSSGMLQTGVLLLDVSRVPDSPQRFTVELRSRRGFDRPPRLLRIEPNVVPILQGSAVSDETHIATGLPDWNFQLDVPGLRFAPFAAPVRVQVDGVEWRRCDCLSESGPQDAVYEFDTASDRVTFGNGVNGQVPAGGARVAVEYAVSDGDKGNVAANRKWSLAGFAGTFGINPDPVTGGAAPDGLIDQRRQARSRSRDEHALVSAADIVSAALQLPLLEVGRAWVLRQADTQPRTGTVTLTAMRARSNEIAGEIPETRRWLKALRGRLVGRMPMGIRLIVEGPQYVDFTLEATVEAVARRDTRAVKNAIHDELAGRLALLGPAARHPGVPVTKRDLIAWMRSVDGVRRVVSLQLATGAESNADQVPAARNALPRIDLEQSAIDVIRAGTRP
jgi:predicted phage baseplate assembly protein